MGERAVDTDRDKFPALLQLLLKHKNMIDYKVSAIRTTTTTTTTTNKGYTHVTESDGSVKDEERQQRTFDDKRFQCWLHPNESNHPIWRCQSLVNMSAKDRIEAVQSNKACSTCLNLGHTASMCRKMFKCRIEGCGQPHHDLLHEAYANGYTGFLSNHSRGAAEVLLRVQSIRCKKDHRKLGNINVLWDSGSTLSFVTFQKARSLGLKGIGQVNLHVTKVGKTTELITSERFVLTLIDNNHNKIEFTTFGIDKISNDIVGINIDSVKDLFPGLSWNKLNRPSCGEIDCLIGFDLANYHPMKKYAAGN